MQVFDRVELDCINITSDLNTSQWANMHADGVNILSEYRAIGGMLRVKQRKR